MSLDRFLAAFETLAAQSVRLVDHVTATKPTNAAQLELPVDPKPATKPATKAETKAADPKPAAKAETKAADPKPAAKAADPTAPLTDETTNAEGFKYGTLKAAVIAYGAANGAPATMAILQDFGVSNAKTIPSELWQTAYDRFTSAPEGEEAFA